MSPGYLSLVLHAHLPFVRHPEHEDFLEESWFYEAITESYIPLLWVLERLVHDNIDFRLTMVFTPPLVSMLRDDLLCRRYVRHLDRLCELAEKEVARTRTMPEYHATARMYRERFLRARADFSGCWKSDLVGAFARLRDSGKLEIVASAATHGFLPLLRMNPVAVRAQVLAGVAHHVETFGCRPRGFWLPECAFYPGLDEVLKDAGIRYFFVDTHAIEFPDHGVRYGVYAPLYCPSGVAAFGRDPESSKQVWSSVEGYPGDPDYREFYRDIGYDLDSDYIKPYIHKDGIRMDTGIKYYRITGRTEAKLPYLRKHALARAAEHASDFVAKRRRQVQADAELFGHWWFEGPEWLDLVLRAMARSQETIRGIHPSEYLNEFPVNQCEIPRASSWGHGGYNDLWINGRNDWIYRHLYAAAERMSELACRHAESEGLLTRALKQAAREVLLAQASDWAFIIARGTAVQYAERRTRDHLLRFNHLYEMVCAGEIDEPWLADMEAKDNIFPNLDYRVFRTDRSPGSV